VDDPIHLIEYSDYLRPWCFPAAVRLRRLRMVDFAEYRKAVEETG